MSNIGEAPVFILSTARQHEREKTVTNKMKSRFRMSQEAPSKQQQQQQLYIPGNNNRTVPPPKLPITMDVWYKLDDHQARRVKILTEDSIVENLKDAIEKEWGDRLHAAPAELKVYAPSKGTDIEKSLASNKKVSECRASSYDEPFIVKAPPKQPQQPNGKLQCCRCCSRIVVF